MAYRIHIVDDSRTDAARIAELTSAFAEKRDLALTVECHPSAEAFLFRYEEDKVCDLLLLDIEMPGMDGVSLAKRIRAEDDRVSIVFITGYSDYIAEGYDVSALHYLVKPVSERKFEEVLERALARRQRKERTVVLKTGTETVQVSLSRVLFLESVRNYVTVHTEGDHSYTVRGTLSHFEGELDNRFLRVGRSYLVNLTKLRRITRTDMIFSDGSALPVPRGYYEILNQAIIRKL